MKMYQVGKKRIWPGKLAHSPLFRGRNVVLWLIIKIVFFLKNRQKITFRYGGDSQTN